MNNEILFKLKYAGISCFCQRRISTQGDPEKKMFLDNFDHKLTNTEDGSVKQYGLWRSLKTIR